MGRDPRHTPPDDGERAPTPPRPQRPLSSTPKEPRRFQSAFPHPASFQSERQSVIHASATPCGVLLKQPHSPTCTRTPLFKSGRYVSISSRLSRARSHVWPRSSRNGHAGGLNVSNSSFGTQFAV